MTTPEDNLPDAAAPPVQAAPPAAPAPYVPPAPGYAAQAAAPVGYAPNDTPNTWMNIVAFVTSLLGLAIVPIIFGHLGVSQSNKGRAELKGLGIAGLVIGYITLAFWIIFFGFIIMAIVIDGSDSTY